jgi:dTDP-4-amino-4,6-dideoxygalactose transaminase
MKKPLVPFLDLRAQHDPIRAEIISAIAAVIDGNAFAGGPFVARFEEDFAAFCGTHHALGVGSGTEALWLALLALGVGRGDEVITVPSTFMATAEAITYCGATPVFVDVDERTYTMDPSQIEQAITPRTRAIIPVHLYGQMADMDPIMEIANRHRLFVVEDACQAHGAQYRGRKAGSIGHAGCFSFYPGKNLGAMGEAGAVVTQDPALAAEIAMLRDHGQRARYHHNRIGWNARMDGIQAAILSLKLRTLGRDNELRRRNAALYNELLAGVEEVVIPHVSPAGLPVYHIYAIRVHARDKILGALALRGISCGIHYPIPIHLQPAYESLQLGPGSFPVAERCANETLSLPMFAQLSAAQIETVVRELKSVLQFTIASEPAFL